MSVDEDAVTIGSMSNHDSTFYGPRRRYTDAEWDNQRSQITTLYHGQHRTLNAVMEIMARDHDFRPTLEMYKRKIKEWALNNKTNRGLPVSQLIRISTARAAVGKRTRFQVRGRQIEHSEIVRYMKRRGLNVEKVLATAHQEAAQDDAAFMCLPTPSPSPEPVEDNEFRTTQVMLSNVKNFVRGNIEIGNWEFDSNGDLRHKIRSDWRARWNVWMGGLNLIRCGLGENQIAFWMRTKFIALQSNTLGQTPDDIVALFTFIQQTIMKQGAEAAKSLIKVVRQITVLNTSDSSLFVACLDTLATADTVQLPMVLATSWRCLLDATIELCSASAPLLQASHIHYLAHTTSCRLDQRTIEHAHQMLQSVETKLGRSSDIYALALTQVLAANVQYGDLRRVINIASSYVNSVKSDFPGAQWYLAQCHLHIHWAHYRLNNIGAAELHLWKAMDLFVEHYGGWHHPDVLLCVTKMEKILQLQKVVEWVVVVSQQRRLLIGEILTQIQGSMPMNQGPGAFGQDHHLMGAKAAEGGNVHVRVRCMN